MNTELNARLTKIGLSNAQSGLLKLVYLNGEMTQTDICSELEIDKSTVAKMVGRLENNGFIRKSVNPDDTRSFLVSLTQKAIEVNLQTQNILLEWTNDVTADLSVEEKEMFYRTLNKVIQKANEISNSSSA